MPFISVYKSNFITYFRKPDHLQNLHPYMKFVPTGKVVSFEFSVLRLDIKCIMISGMAAADGEMF